MSLRVLTLVVAVCAAAVGAAHSTGDDDELAQALRGSLHRAARDIYGIRLLEVNGRLGTELLDTALLERVCA